MILAVNYLELDNFNKINKFSVFPILPYDNLDIPVCAHADMLLCVIDNYVFCYDEYYNDNQMLFNEIEKLGYSIIKSKHKCSKQYPYDIGLNALIIGKKIFCNKRHIAKEIVEYGEKCGYKIINVNQGYSACSTLVVDEYNAVTSDYGIEKALKNEGINVVIVPNDKIILEGYNCGFIGGSCFIHEKTAYFSGNVYTKEYEKVVELLDKLNINIVNLSNGNLRDFGGAKIF